MSGEVTKYSAAEREAFEAARNTGPSDLAAQAEAFTPRQLARIDEALSLGSQETGLLFSVYVGQLDQGRETAEGLVGRLNVPEDGAVLVAVSPGQRELHIVTTPAAQKRLPNRSCALAALGMNSSFSNGDLAGGIVTGIRMLADAAGSPGPGH